MNAWIFILGVLIVFEKAESMPGGWSPVSNLNSPEMLEHGKKATELVSQSMNSLYHMKMINITKAEKQVVSGMNYKMDLVIGPSECKKSQNYSEQELEDCPLQKDKKSYFCNALIWMQPWREEKYKLTRFNCKQADSVC